MRNSAARFGTIAAMGGVVVLVTLVAMTGCANVFKLGELDEYVPPDAPVDAPPVCTTWSQGQSISANVVGKANGWPALSPDGQLLVFAVQQRMTGTTTVIASDLYVAQRSGNDFINPTPIVATAALETEPFWSPDGTSLYYVDDVPAGSRAYHQVDVTGTTFGNDQVTNKFATTNYMLRPQLSPDELEVIYTQGDPTTNMAHGTRLSQTGMTWDLVEFDELNTASDDEYPTLTPDGLAMYFISNRTANERRVFVAERATKTSPFAPPVEIGKLAGPTVQAMRALDVSDDGRVLMFAGFPNMDTAIYISTCQ